ncbi:putative secreted protein [cyanobiont of Ornithocercus magnificus]|nr:putative secreted protein [cyanobiont of Ornithocercus magnificus]
MHRLRYTALLTLLLVSPLLSAPGKSIAGNRHSVAKRLEFALNAKTPSALKALLGVQGSKVAFSRMRLLTSRFPEVSWNVRSSQELYNGLLVVDINVRGQQSKSGFNFTLEAQQRLALRVKEGRIAIQEIISEQSILHSSLDPLLVTLLIPDTVLMGSRYGVDIIFDEPLGNAMVAGGLIEVTPDQVLKQQSPDIPLEPLSSGGLFKSVQAPLRPGVQFWAALLVHPQGVLAVTKRVRVVTSQD